ncbi:MAG: hypothetical protein HXS53_07310 [Theionarchaea archaeon]|nr:hypothetical protein [Theionarchaea archaeon]
MKNPPLVPLYTYLLFVLLCGCVQQLPSPSGSTDREGESQHNNELLIALYAGEGTWEDSVTACEAMFMWMGYPVIHVDARDILAHILDETALLCIPGGDMYQYAQDLTPEGMDLIREFIQNGGGYLGICGGAYLAADTIMWKGRHLSMTSLSLFSGTAEGPLSSIAMYPDYGMCTIICEDPWVCNPDPAVMLYYGGPGFIIEEASGVNICGRYEQGGLPAILFFAFGRGHVFLIGTHPEIEEDSDRDGVLFGDEFDDDGTDWELMKSVIVLCIP